MLPRHGWPAAPTPFSGRQNARTDDIIESVTFVLDLFCQKLLFLVSKKFEADQRLCFFQILGSLFSVFPIVSD